MKSRQGKIRLSPKARAFRLVLHIPAGLITVAAAYLHWSLVLAFLAAFTVYELNEDAHIEDRAFHDIIGYLFGLALGIIGGLAWGAP